MKEHKMILPLVFIFVFMFSFSAIGLCQNVQPFALTIKSTKDVYKIDEILSIEYELKNISKDKILLNKNIVPGGNLFFEIDKVRGPMKMFFAAFWAADQDVEYLEPGQAIKGVWQELSIKQFKGWKDDPSLAGTKAIIAYLQMHLKNKDKLEASKEIVSNAITVEIADKKDLAKDLTKEEAIAIGQKIMLGLTFNKSKYELKNVSEIKESGKKKWRLLFDLEEKTKQKFLGLPVTASGGISVYVDKATGKSTIVSED